jgi:hypothetical protein
MVGIAEGSERSVLDCVDLDWLARSLVRHVVVVWSVRACERVFSEKELVGLEF